MSGSLKIIGDCNGTKLCASAQIDPVVIKGGCVNIFGERCLLNAEVVSATPLGETCGNVPGL